MCKAALRVSIASLTALLAGCNTMEMIKDGPVHEYKEGNVFTGTLMIPIALIAGPTADIITLGGLVDPETGAGVVAAAAPIAVQTAVDKEAEKQSRTEGEREAERQSQQVPRQQQTADFYQRVEQQRELEEQARREQDAQAQTEQEQREREARRCPSSFNYDPPISGVGLNQKTMFLVADKQTGNNVGQVTVVLSRGDASSRVRANVAFFNITSNCMYYVNGYFTSDAAGRNTIQTIDLGSGPKLNPGQSTNGYRDMSVPSTRQIFFTPDFTLAGSVN